MQLQSPVLVTLSELFTLSRQAKMLDFASCRSSSVQGGQKLSKMLGRGMEFAETRLYQQGDDLRNMDWRVTARTGKPHTKVFLEEKERDVLVCVDVRSPMFFATKGVFKSVQASLLAGTFCLNGMYQGNRVGGVLFDEENVQQFRPDRGKRGALPILHALAEIRPHEGRRPEEGKMEQALEHLTRVARPGSLVFIISDFRKTPETFDETLFRLSKHCTVHLCMVYDALEESLPKNVTFSVAGVQKELEINTTKKSVETYREHFLERKARVEALQRYRNINVLEIKTDEECFPVLSHYFRK